MSAQPEGRPSQLRLHSFLLPMLRNAEEKIPGLVPYHLADAAEVAEVFDCRRLPGAFTLHTGQTAWDDALAAGHPIRLPAQICYFELDARRGVLAIEHDEVNGKTPVRCWPFWLFDEDEGEWTIEPDDDGGEPFNFRWSAQRMREDYFSAFGMAVGSFWAPNEGPDAAPDRFHRFIDDAGFFLLETNGGRDESGEPVDDPSPVVEAYVVEFCKRVLGVLTLLDERLLDVATMPDRAKYTNAKRRQKGKPPLSCEHKLLTINTAAARAAARPATGTHESPRLHWRRGHWRHLANGKVWVRRCLVGDPSRGFVEKDYRIEHKPPTEKAAAATPAAEPPRIVAAPQARELVPRDELASPPTTVTRPAGSGGVLRRLRRFFGLRT